MNTLTPQSYSARGTFGFINGEFARIQSQADLNKIAITSMRSLLVDHQIKRLAR